MKKAAVAALFIETIRAERKRLDEIHLEAVTGDEDVFQITLILTANLTNALG